MTDKELRRLSRMELLEMLINQMRENQRLQQQIDELNVKLEDRRILVEEAGSIAEAAMRINGVFQAAEAAAQQYLDNIRRVHMDSLRHPYKEEMQEMQDLQEEVPGDESGC